MIDLLLKTLTKNYCTFSGRSERKEVYSFLLFYILILGIIYVSSRFVSMELAIQILGGIHVYLLCPAISLTVRRLHDINKSAWWTVLLLLPVGNLIILYWCCFRKSQTP